MGDNPKIMIVDDSRLIRQMLGDIARAKGCIVLEASTAEEAVRLYEANRPNLVFMDIILGGKNGIEALDEIRKIDPDANIVMCTSVIGQENIVQKAFHFGAREYITKPFIPEEIEAVIQRYT